MKLTHSQLEMIYNYTNPKHVNTVKLISYLEKHKTIKNDVFRYSSNNGKKSLLGCDGYCWFLDKEPMFKPIDRVTFIRRIPFYYYETSYGEQTRNGLIHILPFSEENLKSEFDYDSFYCDLEWMYYELGLPLKTIFEYAKDQVETTHEPKEEKHTRGSFPSLLTTPLFADCGLSSKDLFQQWRHYLHLCEKLGWTEFTPVRFITAYNEALECTGHKPIIYYPIKNLDLMYNKGEDYISCKGHFPCDKSGKPILKWTSLLVKNAAEISYQAEKSQCGELKIMFAPKTIIYVLKEEPAVNEDDDEPVWQQIYAGPQTMEFDHSALREFRKARGLTQSNVADAIGTSVRTYQKWESGETTPDGCYLIRLMNWLSIDDVQALAKLIDSPEE